MAATSPVPTPQPLPAALSLADLPDSLLLSILELLDAHTLLQRVALVSRRFHDLSQSESLWLARLPPPLTAALHGMPSTAAGSPSSSSAAGEAAQHAQRRTLYPRLYCSLLNANLLANPWFCLREQMGARRSAGGDAPGRGKTPWRVPAVSPAWDWGPEAQAGLVMAPGVPLMPPMPLPPYDPRARGGPSWRDPLAVASTYFPTYLVQEVDLVEELRLRGVPEAAACAFLDACPALVFEVYVASRFDCTGWFTLTVALDNRAGPVPMNDSLGQWMSSAAACGTTPRQDAEPNVWRRHKLRVAPCAPGVRRAVVELVGSERRFWAGHYGAKFAAPLLQFEMARAGQGQAEEEL